MPVTIEPWLGPMPQEYLNFLAELGLSEADVHPLIGCPQLLQANQFLLAFAEFLIATAGAVDQENSDLAGRLLEALSPGANANKLMRKLDRRLHAWLNRIGTTLPEGVLAVGVYPLDSFTAKTVPRKNGVLLLLASGAFEFLEYAVSLTLMPEPPSQRQKVELLIKAMRDFVDPSPRLPVPGTLSGPSWTRVRESIYHGVTWAEWFLLCHEYGHHALNHLNGAQAERYTDRNGAFEVVQYLHVHEYEADLWAMSMLIRLASAGAPPQPTSFGISMACAAPFYFLGLLELMDKMKGTVPIKYPSSAARILNLEIFLRSCRLYDRQHLYLYWTFLELLDLASQEVAGCDLITARQQDPGLVRDLKDINSRMRPILLGIMGIKKP